MLRHAAMNARFLAPYSILLALSAEGCGSPAAPDVDTTSQAITSGAPDSTDSSAVFIVAKAGGVTGGCSGVVVSPHVVLTAGHCSISDVTYSIFLGSNYNDPAAHALGDNYVNVTEHHAHPKYDASSNLNDIGVLITDAPLPRPSAVLNRTRLAYGDVGRPIRIVGFGQTSGGSKTMGQRMEGQTTIADLDATTLTVTGLPNICLYDSGGPTFMSQNGQDVVVGIHFIIDSTACNSQGTDVRVDAYASFVDGYIHTADPPPAPDAAAPADPPSAPEVDAGQAAAPASPATPSSEQRASGCAVRTPGSPTWANLWSSLALVALLLARRPSLRARTGSRRRQRPTVPHGPFQ
jgi:hypothetical protein